MITLSIRSLFLVLLFILTSAWGDTAEDYFAKGKACAERADWDTALANYNRAIEIKPDFAAVFASRGGQATSRAKRKSSRANGRKGGRPRKKTSTEVV